MIVVAREAALSINTGLVRQVLCSRMSHTYYTDSNHKAAMHTTETYLWSQ